MHEDRIMGLPATAELRPPLPKVLPADERSAGLQVRCLIEDVVAHVFRVDPVALRQASRGRASVALARQVAMYIAHVVYGMSLTEVGALFGRDRTTVAHACAVVEARREDASFEAAIALIERIARAVVGAVNLAQSRRFEFSVEPTEAHSGLA
jgi:Bacterial dnaA protein helix-turn-helix